MMGLLRRFCSYFRLRLNSLNIIRFLFVVALIFYIGLYSVIVDNSVCDNCECHDCVNKSNNVKSNFLSLKQELALVEETNINRQSVQTFLLVLVLTGPGNVERRNAMRSTWLNTTRFNTAVSRRFVIGTANLPRETGELLEQEQNLNGDMLFLEDFKDEYSQLTQKLLKALMWISVHVQCSFVMKVDDDTFARLDVIVHELKEKYDATDNLYWGFHRGNSRVKYAGPWAESKWILCDHYLPYALGGGYIISLKLVHYVANISSLVVLYNSEDVSLGAWLSPLNLIRVHDTRFDTEWRSRGCRNVHIVSHKQSIENMYEKFINLRDHNQLCTKEEHLAKSFIYSWNVPPSRCCERTFGIP